MQLRLAIPIYLLMIMPACVQAQHIISACARGKQQYPASRAEKVTIADPAELDYDVHYVKLNLSVTDTGRSISGDVQTTGTVAVSSMSKYVFELDNQLIIDSCKINGISRAVATNGDVRSVSLVTAALTGTSFTAQVFYHGLPKLISTPYAIEGIFSTNNFTYTHSEPYASKNWWPCKMALDDKIDSSALWLTVDSSLKAGSNGTLDRVTVLPGGKKRFEWTNHSPIAYYLISFAAGKYTDYSYYAHFTGSSDSVLVQNFIPANSTTFPLLKAGIDSVGLMIDYFSGLFGRYPFWKEKYGHCIIPYLLGGGMENQTMTTLAGAYGTDVYAHELGHQWWGNNVTCGSFHDIWLNEGFATYCEMLFYEKYWGHTYAMSQMAQLHQDVIVLPKGSVYVPDTTDENRIFNEQLTYGKGASVVHMLRYLAGNDAAFFNFLRNYQQSFKGRTALTVDLQRVAETTYGRNLDTFFKQWVYGEGHPVYTAQWNQKSGHIYLYMVQESSASISAIFNFPVEVKFSGSAGDTVITVNMDSKTKVIDFYWNNPVNAIAIDPNNWIPNDTLSIVKNEALGIGNMQAADVFTLLPNPVPDRLNITYALTYANAVFSLYDITGRLMIHEMLDSRSGKTMIDLHNQATGMYLYRITGHGMNQQVGKIIKE